jgi:hypothetical protein
MNAPVRSGSALLAMRGVVKRLGGVQALRGADFDPNCSAPAQRPRQQTDSRTKPRADNACGAERSTGGKHNQEEAQ